MAFDVTEAIGRIQDLWLSIEGIRAAPDEPPERLDPFPIAITFERTGVVDLTKNYSHAFAPESGSIWSELHIARQDNLSLAVKAAYPFRVQFLRALQGDPDLADFVMLVKQIRWTFMPMEWNGLPTIGYRFELDFDTELAPS